MVFVQIEKVLLLADQPMRAAIEAIDSSGLKIAIIVDTNRQLLGMVTDGDIRRTLLTGRGLETPICEFMNTTPHTAFIGSERSVLLSRLRQEQILHMPLVDSEGVVHDLAYLPMLEQQPNRENEVVIMAGGLGTRLQPLTEKIPKPLVSVGGRPLIDTIIDRLVSQGLTQITLCVNYLGHLLKEHLGDGSRYGANVMFVHENKRMGTAGALSLLERRPKVPFFVMNGDILTSVDLMAMHDFHQESGAKATMAVNNFSHEVPFGVVELSGKRITSLREKPQYNYLVNAGIYLFDPEVLDYMPSDEFYEMNSFFDRLIEVNVPVVAFPLREHWLDIGRPDDLERANITYDEIVGRKSEPGEA
ncbi:MAG: alcohol dehydrogenase [Hyphomicrobiales bacterium]|nr:MAG: alcohol dehydrogenase [Hyphomicrobiales bacterium]